jgi:hypothetical protein
MTKHVGSRNDWLVLQNFTRLGGDCAGSIFTHSKSSVFFITTLGGLDEGLDYFLHNAVT